MATNKYGLNIRPKKPPVASRPPPPRPPPSIFGNDDDDDDVEAEISRHAAQTRNLQQVKEQHRKAMEQDPTVFDYDGVYDEMKVETARPKVEATIQREPKYITALKKKAEERKREQEIIYEKNLLKERRKEDSLYGDKETFVTASYVKKLKEQDQWLEEERLRKIREEKDDVTKKKDMSAFYFGLTNNVAFGGRQQEDRKRPKQQETSSNDKIERTKTTNSDAEEPEHSFKRGREPSAEPETTHPSQKDVGETVLAESKNPGTDVSVEEKGEALQPPTAQTAQATTKAPEESYKRTDDALAAARERYLARKKNKVAE